METKMINISFTVAPSSAGVIGEALFAAIEQAMTPNKEECNIAHAVLGVGIFPDPDEVHAVADMARIGREISAQLEQLAQLE